jgi:hypothetical protein
MITAGGMTIRRSGIVDPDIGHIHAAAHDHDQDVDGRGDHSQNGGHGDEGPRLEARQSESHEHGRDERTRSQDAGRRRARDHAGKHDQKGRREQKEGLSPVKCFQQRRGQAVETARGLEDLHEEDGRENDEHDVEEAEAAFDEMADRKAPSPGERPGRGRKKEARTDRNPDRRRGQNEDGRHDNENEGFRHAMRPFPAL